MVKKVLYVIFFDNKGPIMQLPIPKGRTLIEAFYKNDVLKKLKAHFNRHQPKTAFKYLCLLHDNAPANNMTRFLESETVNVLPYLPFPPDLAPFDYFLFLKLKFQRDNKTKNLLENGGVNTNPVHFNLFPNKPCFLCVCSTNLLKTLWEKEKLLVTSNFSFSHSIISPFG